MGRNGVEGPKFNVAVVGGGPGGISPFIAADRMRGEGADFVGSGALLVDGGNPRYLGQGGIRKWIIGSNSASKEFADQVDPGNQYKDVRTGSRGQALEEAGESTVQLSTVVAPFLGELGQRTAQILRDAPRSDVLTATSVPRLQLHGDDQGAFWGLVDDRGREIATARNVVLAPGAIEPPSERLQKFEADLLVSGDLISGRRLDEVRQRMQGGEVPVFIAASHGGASAAELVHGSGELIIVHRGPIRRFFDSTAAADAAGYQYERGDVCESTDRVHRYGGVRGKPGEFIGRAMAGELPNVHLLQVADLRDAEDVLAGAPMLVQSTGHRANIVEPYAGSEQLGPAVDRRGHVVVDSSTRVHGFDGEALPNLFGIGHGHGTPPSTEYGGEPNFGGRIDSINMFQGPIGEQVVRNVLRRT